ncbi:MAG: hypothetical protein ACJ766_06720 [Thermoleophilaceae bacterium]|jgi:hypothetical protein
MCFNRDRTEREQEARRRLAEQPIVKPTQPTRPRGNSDVDQRDLQRSLDRLEALVGR